MQLQTETQKTATRASRSPNYPQYDVSDAINILKSNISIFLRSEDGVDPDTFAQVLGYKDRASCIGLFASLRYYGLIIKDDEGDFHLTPLGKKAHAANKTSHAEIAREVYNTNDIIIKMADVLDENDGDIKHVRTYLEDRHFSEKAVTTLIKNFTNLRKTIGIAQPKRLVIKSHTKSVTQSREGRVPFETEETLTDQMDEARVEMNGAPEAIDYDDGMPIEPPTIIKDVSDKYPPFSVTYSPAYGLRLRNYIRTREEVDQAIEYLQRQRDSL